MPEKLDKAPAGLTDRASKFLCQVPEEDAQRDRLQADATACSHSAARHFPPPRLQGQCFSPHWNCYPHQCKLTWRASLHELLWVIAALSQPQSRSCVGAVSTSTNKSCAFISAEDGRQQILVCWFTVSEPAVASKQKCAPTAVIR